MYLNNDYLATTPFKQAISGRVGVLVTNGIESLIHFRYPDLRKFGLFYG